MRDYGHQTRIALITYLERGESVLAALASDDLDAVAHWMSLRKAAFHNFRAADSIAKKSGYDVIQDDAMAAVVKRLRPINSNIEVQLESCKLRLERQVAKIVRARSAIRKYRSEPNGPEMIEQTV